VTDTAGLGAADVAMLELIEGKLDWEVLEGPPSSTRERSAEEALSFRQIVRWPESLLSGYFVYG